MFRDTGITAIPPFHDFYGPHVGNHFTGKNKPFSNREG